MSYLHCHTKNCGWSQDDFWNLNFKFTWSKWKKSWWKLRLDIGYNPISKLRNKIVWLWKPRWITFDDWFIRDITKYTGVKVKIRKIEKKIDQYSDIRCYNKPEDVYTIIKPQVFSWQWLIVEIVKEWKNFRQMKWWTYKQWKKQKSFAKCPKCGKRNFDID